MTSGRLSLLPLAERMRKINIFTLSQRLETAWALAKTQFVYRSAFARVGRNTWLKRPDQIIGPSRISIGDSVRIERGAVLYAISMYGGEHYDGRISIGDGTYINRGFNATSAVAIEVGSDVSFGSNVFLCDFDHGFKDPIADRIHSPLLLKGAIRIGDRSWIGANVYVAGGVTLGEGCVVGTNSVVTRSFPALTVLAGIPARAIKRFDFGAEAWLPCADSDSEGQACTKDNSPSGEAISCLNRSNQT